MIIIFSVTLGSIIYNHAKLMGIFYIYQVLGPAVCKRGNQGPWSAPMARVHPRTTYQRKIPLRVGVQPDHEHGNGIGRVDMERAPDSV